MNKENLIPYQFKKGDVGNPTGRNQYTKANELVKACVEGNWQLMGYDRPMTNEEWKAAVESILMALLFMDDAALKKRAKQPVSLFEKVAIEAMLKAKPAERWRVVMDIINRIIGKPKEFVDHTSNGDKLELSINLK